MTVVTWSIPPVAEGLTAGGTLSVCRGDSLEFVWAGAVQDLWQIELPSCGAARHQLEPPSSGQRRTVTMDAVGSYHYTSYVGRSVSHCSLGQRITIRVGNCASRAVVTTTAAAARGVVGPHPIDAPGEAAAAHAYAQQ